MQKLSSRISVVVITKNEVDNIGDCIASCKKISNDIVVVDSISNDGTQELAKSRDCTVVESVWEGYGIAKNLGASKAKNDWILSIDADERIDAEMEEILKTVAFESDHLYGFRRLNHIGKIPIRHGEWNPDTKFRLYNRNNAKWSLAAVHEEVEGPPWLKKTILPGYILHYSYASTDELRHKLDHYARLGAEEMKAAGKTIGSLSFLRPFFKFIKGYYLKGGFLDGKIGYQIAKANANAQRKKFKYLKELEA